MKKRVIPFIMTLMLVLSLCVTVQAETVVKNIIYMIPDGGGYTLYDFADMVKQAGGLDSVKFPNKTPSDTNPMTLKSYLAGTVTTASANSSITDSAAAATALATGNKTVNGYVGVDRKVKPVANLVEAAQSVGKSVGLVSTVEWTHATPAGFSAHTINRNDYESLYKQVENKELDVVLGSGYGMYSQWATIQNAVDRGYKIINDKAELMTVKPGDNIWGNIVQGNFGYDCNFPANRPTLAEMTDAAITAMSDDADGFFLMVEGSLIDSGGHNNNALQTTSDYIAFDAAFKVAVDFAKGRNDTVVIAVPDHDTGGMNLHDDMSAEIELVKNGENPSTISWTSTNHTGRNVPVWIYTPKGVDIIEGLNSVTGDTTATRENYVIDNTLIAPYCASLMDVNLETLTEKLFVDVTNIGVMGSLTDRFTFNNGDKYVYPNDNAYYKNGEKISMGTKQAIYVGGKMYVPAEIIDEADWNYPTVDYDGITGSGTAEDPYIFNDANDFVEFAQTLMEGETYKDKYIKQTADIDLSDRVDFTGLGKAQTFAGIYNGDGHIINVNLTAENSGTDTTVFPYLTGTIMNVGITGSMANKGTAMGVVRSVRPGAKVVNCFSNANLTGAQVCGISYTTLGIVENCFFGGTLSGNSDSKEYAMFITATADSVNKNNYYPEKLVSANTIAGVNAVSEAEATTTLAATLNSGRASAANTLGVSVDDISYWTNADGYPVHYVPGPAITNVTVTPSAVTVEKGSGVQLTATVTGEFNPILEVTWSIEDKVDEGTCVNAEGYVTVSENETAETFNVMAKSKQDGSKVAICCVTVIEAVGKQNGSKENPYLIENADDFVEFANDLIDGKTFSGKFFKQTADIDLSLRTDFKGLGKAQTFAGTYNGDGHIINVNLTAENSGTDNTVFPYLTGTLMNVGISGSIANKGTAIGLVRSVRPGARVLNCYSVANLTGAQVCGITWTSLGTVENCFFGGTLNGSAESKEYAFIITATADAVLTNNYYDEAVTSANTLDGVTAVAGEMASGRLNGGIENMAKASGISSSEFKNWSNEEGQPQLISEWEKGDVNSNGKIDVFDAVLVLKHVAEISALNEKAQLSATGVFGKAPEVADAISILRYLARIINEL